MRDGKKSPFVRLEVHEFMENPKLVAALRTAVKTMMAVPTATDFHSWTFWHYSHWMPPGVTRPMPMRYLWNQCKHHQSYFYAWHRGFVLYFEELVRKLSGDPQLALPYWDYYKYPRIPKIYADPTLSDGSANPLYWKNRKGKIITGLSYEPFSPKVTEFPFGPGTSFEDLIEANPHGHVHDQIGGSMGTVPTAAADPIFWLHHVNIDRYWSAWLKAGGKRKMPDPTSLWWQQTYYYNRSGSWRVSIPQMIDTLNLGYTYEDESFPVAPAGAQLPSRPPVVAAVANGARQSIAFTPQAFSIEIGLDRRWAPGTPVTVSLEGVRMIDLFSEGGFGYRVYANLPVSPAPIEHESEHAAGDFGSFELSIAGITASMPGMGGAMASTPSNGSVTLNYRAVAGDDGSVVLSFVPYGDIAAGRTSAIGTVSRIVVSA
jgi:tyrosinase